MAQIADAPKKKGRNWLFILGGFLAFCAVCVVISQIWSMTPAGQSSQATRTAEAVAQADADATEAARPTNTPEPTATTGPTETPAPPSETPEPTATTEPTPAPEPIVLSGSGDDVIDVEKWSGPAIARITYDGGRNFIIETYDSGGEGLDLLVNHIGAYQGTRPIDFRDDEQVARFGIQADGNWAIEIVPLAEAEVVSVPGEVTGRGDMVYILDGEADTLQATAEEGNFIVEGYGERNDLIVNEIAPYEGESIIRAGTVVIVVQSRGGWTINFTD